MGHILVDFGYQLQFESILERVAHAVACNSGFAQLPMLRFCTCVTVSCQGGASKSQCACVRACVGVCVSVCLSVCLFLTARGTPSAEAAWP